MTREDFDQRYRVQHVHSDQYVVYDKGENAKAKGEIVCGPLPKYRADGVLLFMRQHCDVVAK